MKTAPNIRFKALRYSKALPRAEYFPAETVLFYDSILEKKAKTKSWIAQFQYRIPLKAGEDLKNLKSLERVLSRLARLSVAKSTQLTFVAMGGGSIGDFVGFMASVYLRGRRLISIPSTWLAAIDSAHGGKTGLNFLETKNQIGSFYPAEQIWICEELLVTQPQVRLQESFGEAIKMAILVSPKVFRDFEKELSLKVLLKNLKILILQKYKIVNLDPQEKNGHRRLLNLGHTLGHIFESHYGYAHGVAVLLGLQFAARWSLEKKLLKEKDFFRISLLIESLNLPQDLNTSLQGMTLAQIKKLLSRDKKITGPQKMDFIFIKKIGSCQRVSVELADILNEVIRQKRVY